MKMVVSLARSSIFYSQMTVFSRRSLSSESFKFADLKIERTRNPLPKPNNDNLVFGASFSDHMFSVHFIKGQGWDTPRIMPIAPLSLHPAAKVFHYALECFEGMKAYYCADKKVRLFRPMENMLRLQRSAARATLADNFDPNELLKCLKKLIEVDQEWVPRSNKCSLYIRPTMIATEPRISVSPAENTHLFVITGPVGPYFPTGLKPVTLLADPAHCRSWPGGCGNTKMGANYAPTCHTQIIATNQSAQQVLWLFGPERYLTEVGSMNLFVFWQTPAGKMELVTPPLDGLILPGITRKSLLELAKQWGEFDVAERPITMGEVQAALKTNRLKEMFGAGTACVVCPVAEIIYENQRLVIPTMSQGAPVTMRFLKSLTDIQYGRTQGHPWSESIETF